MPEPEVVTAAVARNLRGERARRGWTLDELAARAQVSKGMLISIEQARTNPSIATLCRIADAFGVSLARLVEVADSPVVRVVHRDDVVTLWRGPAGGRAELRFGAEPPDAVELWHWTLAPGEAFDGEAHPPGSREVLTIEAGTLTLSVDGGAHRVAAGESVAFRADRPHRYANEDDEELRLVMVVTQPPLPADG
ncbi:MAG TPA: XRE family transcriptional regulator [Egibacteraceae bacterium]